MRLGLEGKRAVVTGASKGIGLAITRGLVDEGAHVLAGARSISDDLQELVNAGSVHFVACDLSEPDAPALRHLAEQVVGADAVALVGRIRGSVREVEDFGK